MLCSAVRCREEKDTTVTASPSCAQRAQSENKVRDNDGMTLTSWALRYRPGDRLVEVFEQSHQLVPLLRHKKVQDLNHGHDVGKLLFMVCGWIRSCGPRGSPRLAGTTSSSESSQYSVPALFCPGGASCWAWSSCRLSGEVLTPGPAAA